MIINHTLLLRYQRLIKVSIDCYNVFLSSKTNKTIALMTRIIYDKNEVIIDMIKNFAENVARLRKKFGFSQDELARKIDVNRQTISKIERGTGNPTLETIEKISEVFNATPIQLFGTPKEIAVSDTPVILDRIDEYNDKIQKILKVGAILENEESIERLLNKLTQLEHFFVDNSRIDIDGEPILDENNQVIYDSSTFDYILAQEKTIDRIIEKLNFIQNKNLNED